jgi:hypothetical protein
MSPTRRYAHMFEERGENKIHSNKNRDPYKEEIKIRPPYPHKRKNTCYFPHSKDPYFLFTLVSGRPVYPSLDGIWFRFYLVLFVSWKNNTHFITHFTCSNTFCLWVVRWIELYTDKFYTYSTVTSVIHTWETLLCHRSLPVTGVILWILRCVSYVTEVQRRTPNKEGNSSYTQSSHKDVKSLI